MRLPLAALLSVAAVVLLFATPCHFLASIAALVGLLLTFNRDLLKEPDHEYRDHQARRQ